LPASAKSRVPSVDALRGLVMIVMALDHTREYTSISLYWHRRFSHDQRNSGQAQVAISRPARGDPSLPHEHQSVSIGQRKPLIPEFLGDRGRFGQRSCVECLNRQHHRQFLDESEELYGADLIVAPEKTAMAFGDYQRGGRQARRIGEQSLEESVIAVGAVQKGNQSGRNIPPSS
jgi:hypothetical protein